MLLSESMQATGQTENVFLLQRFSYPTVEHLLENFDSSRWKGDGFVI
jgi:hypothetical protein